MNSKGVDSRAKQEYEMTQLDFKSVQHFDLHVIQTTFKPKRVKNLILTCKMR